MTIKVYMKQNDTMPRRVYALKHNGTAVDLTGATVKFIMRAQGSSSTKVNASATVSDQTNGLVYYAWSSSDTDTTGEYEAEFQVTYSDSTVETFPNSGNIRIKIVDDIGS